MRKFVIAAAALFFAVTITAAPKVNVKGRVIAAGRGVPGVHVSDGNQIVVTDAKGYYSMVSDKADSMLFITTPSGYVARRTAGITPDFFAMLTRPVSVCERHDFVLVPQNQDDYSVLFLTDVHFARVPGGTDREVFTKEVYPALERITAERQERGKAVYCIQLGDFAHDSKWYCNDFDELDAHRFFSGLGYSAPVFGVSGNHDNDGAITSGDRTDFVSAWQYRRTWGPDRYAMNIGRDHWIFLDDIVYKNTPVEHPSDNINGDRSYDTRLTDAQLEWLRKDVADVPDGTRIYLCLHCPLFNTANEKERLSEEQVEILDGIFSRFPKVTVYSGHAHMMHIPSTGKYTRFEQYVLPASSGTMWQSCADGFPSVCNDGTAPGIFTGDNYACGSPVHDFVSVKYGPLAMRVYDMNGVAEYYAENADVRQMMKYYSPKYRHDFADGTYKDMIFVNYWLWRPDETVHVIEDGHELEVRKVKMEDPLYNVCWFVPETVRIGRFKKSFASYRWPHMFSARALTPDAPVVIRITDASGKVVREEKLVRPKPFVIDVR